MTIAVDAKLKRATGRAAEELIPMLVWLAASYAAANAALFGNLAPFGISCAAAAKKKTLLPATAGAILGYTLAGGGSLRYPAAVLLVAAVKLIFEKLGEGALPSALYAAASTLVVSTAFASLGAEIGMPQIMAEAVLCGGVAWFFSRTGVLLGDGRPILALSKADRACIAVTAAIGAASLAVTEMFCVSAGAVLGGFAVLLSAEYGGEGSGAAAGAAASAATCRAAAVRVCRTSLTFGLVGKRVRYLSALSSTSAGRPSSPASWIAARMAVSICLRSFSLCMRWLPKNSIRL